MLLNGEHNSTLLTALFHRFEPWHVDIKYAFVVIGSRAFVFPFTKPKFNLKCIII